MDEFPIDTVIEFIRPQSRLFGLKFRITERETVDGVDYVMMYGKFPGDKSSSEEVIRLTYLQELLQMGSFKIVR